MYHPYFRGRQNELIVIRECAELLARHKFVPIVEPVKSTTNGLVRALSEIERFGGQSVLIVNPGIGDFRGKTTVLESIVSGPLGGMKGVSAGICVSAATSIRELQQLCVRHLNHPLI